MRGRFPEWPRAKSRLRPDYAVATQIHIAKRAPFAAPFLPLVNPQPALSRRLFRSLRACVIGCLLFSVLASRCFPNVADDIVPIQFLDRCDSEFSTGLDGCAGKTSLDVDVSISEKPFRQYRRSRIVANYRLIPLFDPQYHLYAATLIRLIFSKSQPAYVSNFHAVHRDRRSVFGRKTRT